jgi:hypothetical protein
MARTSGYNTVPGYSALAEARWRLATAPGWEWHVAGTLGLAFAVGLVAGALTRWSLLLLPVLVVVLGGGLAVTTLRRRELVASWRQGAKGERQTAKLLAKLDREGWKILHDLAIPGSRANVDHLAIGSGGVWVIDSKLWSSRVHWDPRHGWMHGQSAITSELNTTSSSSGLNCGVEVLELDAGILGGEAPVNATADNVACCLPRRDLPL